MSDNTFYLGRLFDPKTAKLTANDINYNSADLTTHAVVTGMTGSGKTGLRDRKSTRLNSSHEFVSRMPSSA